MLDLLPLLCVGLLLFLLYMLPFAIANARGVRNQPLIFIVNFALGWSGLGWIVCMLWACMADSRKSQSRDFDALIASLKGSMSHS